MNCPKCQSEMRVTIRRKLDGTSVRSYEFPVCGHKVERPLRPKK